MRTAYLTATDATDPVSWFGEHAPNGLFDGVCDIELGSVLTT